MEVSVIAQLFAAHPRASAMNEYGAILFAMANMNDAEPRLSYM